jgi:dTDP-4-dehydrorhamnose 3,5-epimerase
MKFIATRLPGAFIVEPERCEDSRGFFVRTWCQREFESHGLESRLVQCSESFSPKKGTLRGMHFQAAPHQETKLVRCIAGAIYDVIIDLRPHSPTFRQHLAVVLTASDGRALYVPKGFAHGHQTLEDRAVVSYQMSEFHCTECARGVRWNDPAFRLPWPEAHSVISERDMSYPDFTLSAVTSAPACANERLPVFTR